MRKVARWRKWFTRVESEEMVKKAKKNVKLSPITGSGGL
jgi:hypothetical protein